MLEVVFCDSAKGSMKVAKNYDETNFLGGAISYFGKKPSKAELKKQFAGKAIGGSPQDVICIGFHLDIGNISGEVDSIERQDVFCKLFGRFNFDNKEQEQFFQEQRKDIERLLEAANSGTPIRIWKSNAPYSTCGFYHVCYLLRNTDCKISVISLPESKLSSQNEIVIYGRWGEVAPGRLYQFLPLETQLTEVEKRMFSIHWRELMTENSPLRANINGNLVSVPEDFYDFIITQNLPDKDFVMARLIGKLMGNYNLGVSDSWYALRIDKMIEKNKLVVIRDGGTSHPYEKVLRKLL